MMGGRLIAGIDITCLLDYFGVTLIRRTLRCIETWVIYDHDEFT